MLPHIPDVVVLEELGRGQGSAVFRGTFKGDACAIKFPHPRALAAHLASSHFEQDVLRLARIRNTGLPRVLQLDASEGVPYAILDVQPGPSLAQLLAGRLPELEAVDLALQLATCVSQLHAAGFVHGDLSAMQVVWSGNPRRVRLLDTGSVCRPIPFDGSADLKNLGVILKQLSELTVGSDAELADIVDRWSRGGLPDEATLPQLQRQLNLRISALISARGSVPPQNVNATLEHAFSSITKRHVRGELALLRRRWESQAEAGRVLMLVGCAGSGKTRLLRGFCEHVQTQGTMVFAIKCAPEDFAPFSAIKQLLERHLRDISQLEGGHRARVERSLRTAAGPMAFQLRLLSPALAQVLRNPPSAMREGDVQEVFIAGLAEFLAKCLDEFERSTLIIDDVHWLDASSRMVLSRLAERACPRGHMVLCTARDDEELRESLDRFEAALPAELLEKLSLGSLGERDACDVVAEFLGASPLAVAAIAEPLSQLSDGTPLSLLELLELACERRLLRPRHGVWELDSAPLHHMRLPGSSRMLIERRLSSLTPATLSVLRAAAIMRSRIDPHTLAVVTDISAEQVRSSLDHAVGVRLLRREGDGDYGFIHDCVWEALLAPVAPHEQRLLHQRVADALTQRPANAPERDYELARHLAAGILERNPRRSYEALRHAAKCAIAACDDALALSFLKPAKRAAELAQTELSREFYVDLAETSLRTGATSESQKYFALALQRSNPGWESAHVRGRMAWVHHWESDADACWSMLEAALLEFDRRLPSNSPDALVSAGIERFGLWTRHPKPHPRPVEIETLCDLYALCTRVSFDSGHPLRGLASIARLSAAATQLPKSRVLVQAELFTAFGLALVSPHAPWRSRLEHAREIARELSDPVAQTLCLQIQFVIAGWLGDIEDSERIARVCLYERGHFMELGEFCHVSFSFYATDIALGRPQSALGWLERAISRVQQSGRAPAVFTLLEESACTTLLALAREHEIADLRRRAARVQRAPIQPGSYFHLLSYQARVANLIETNQLGEPFEALVRDWESLNQKPQQAHLLVTVYFVHVAHARIHQCLRAERSERAALVAKLERALSDVEAVMRVPIFAAHAYVARAALSWFRSADAKAERLLVKAEALARETGCVWVTYAAARLRAHMLRARGKHASAQDAARAAAQIAQQYGPRHRLRHICEEFDLPQFMDDGKLDGADTRSARRHLDALLHIARASSRELGPERQARFIVDELLGTLAAERGFLFMRDASNKLQCHAACHAAGQDLLATRDSYDALIVEQVYATGQTLLAGGSERRPDGRSDASTPAPQAAHERACIVVALVLREQVVGVLYLDRHAAVGGFSSEDVALLEALANQVPVALELADALRERERLEVNLRQAQKMEAIGRLAGGIAHDFNNILATIEFAAGCLTDRVHPQGEEDLSEIREAARRGADLTRQLLTFSRGKSIPPRRVDLVDVMQGVLPLLSRLVRADVHIHMSLPEHPLATLADPSQIERLLMNLSRNASDAMPQGGHITIRLVKATALPDHIAPVSGAEHAAYAELSVVDTGMGMSEDVRARLFEPFFTTKASQQGTGLGLTIVYTIVKQYGGHIEVASELGAGATFRIYLPLCQELAELERIHVQSEHAADDAAEPAAVADLGHLILVIDDDDAQRRQTARMLREAGYRVLVARDGEDALRVVGGIAEPPALAVTDMQMPGIDGAQLALRLRAKQPEIKLVFVSGDAPDTLLESGLLNDAAVFLQKPFSPDALLREVESLLHAALSSTRSGVFKLGSSGFTIEEAEPSR